MADKADIEKEKAEAGRRLREMLDKAKISQAEFAEKMDTTPQNVTNWLNRGLPSKRIFEASVILKTPASKFIAGEVSEDVKKMLEGVGGFVPDTAKQFLNVYMDKLSKLPPEEKLKLSAQIELMYRMESDKR